MFNDLDNTKEQISKEFQINKAIKQSHCLVDRELKARTAFCNNFGIFCCLKSCRR